MEGVNGMTDTVCLYLDFAPRTGYNHGCRCPRCSRSMSVKNSKYHAQHRARLNMRKQTWRDSPHGKTLMRLRNAAYIQTPHGKAVSAAKSAKRRALKIKQTPKLNNIERQQVAEIYRRCQELTESTGVMHHVDHRIPISKGGEHHPQNLQILTAEENIKKRDKIL